MSNVGDQVIGHDWKWRKEAQAAEIYNRIDWTAPRNAARWKREAGFLDVEVQRFTLPWGDWLGRQGHMGEETTMATARDGYCNCKLDLERH